MTEKNNDQLKLMAAAFGDAIEEGNSAPEGFQVLGELDRGGMAIVYLAQQLEPMREVALKVVLPRFAEEEHIRERFQREGQAMAALEHAGVLPIYQVGEWDGLGYIAMKLASGGTLQNLLEQGLPDVKQAVDWMIAAGEAVHYAHQRGVLHRDLKPGNLLFDTKGAIYVGDFGVAKIEFARDGGLTRTEALVGTPHYLAPEVASGETNGGSVATDLYGLGAVLYECLTGRRPHESGGNLAALLRAVVDDNIVSIRKHRPEIAKDLAVVCEKALAKNADDRYGSVLEFVEDLQRWRSGLNILARPATLAEKIWLWSKRYPVATTLAGLLLCTLMGGSLALISNNRELRGNNHQLDLLLNERGDLLQESLIERAKASRLIREPGFRSQTLNLLASAGDIKPSERIREEAIAAMTYWDVSDIASDEMRWLEKGPYEVLEVKGGLRLTDEKDFDVKIPLSGVLRCQPACSADGRFVAIVKGDRMEVLIYDLSRNLVFAIGPLEKWPERLEFARNAEVFRIVFEGGEANLMNVRGEYLLGGFDENDSLLAPVGFSSWTGQFLSPVDASPYGGALSGSGEFLVTTSVLGIQIWNANAGKAVDFYEVENQRIDAPTDAWWLDDQRLLIQVPGAQEILKIGNDGEVMGNENHMRVPGTLVKNVFENGDWLVEVMGEDGGKSKELWPSGDANNSQQWQPRQVGEDLTHSDGVIYCEGWTLIIPEGKSVLDVFFRENEKKVITVTTDYHIYEWDLTILENELKEWGF